MALMFLEITFFEKKQGLTNFASFSFFVYLLPGFVNEK